MSERRFKDQLSKYRRQYQAMKSKKARGKQLDRLLAVHICDRKYMIKLLNGRRDYKPRRGRGNSYRERVK